MDIIFTYKNQITRGKSRGGTSCHHQYQAHAFFFLVAFYVQSCDFYFTLFL